MSTGSNRLFPSSQEPHIGFELELCVQLPATLPVDIRSLNRPPCFIGNVPQHPFRMDTLPTFVEEIRRKGIENQKKLLNSLSATYVVTRYTDVFPNPIHGGICDPVNTPKPGGAIQALNHMEIAFCFPISKIPSLLSSACSILQEFPFYLCIPESCGIHIHIDARNHLFRFPKSSGIPLGTPDSTTKSTPSIACTCGALEEGAPDDCDCYEEADNLPSNQLAGAHIMRDHFTGLNQIIFNNKPEHRRNYICDARQSYKPYHNAIGSSGAYQTCEFRIFDASISYDYISRCIALCLARAIPKYAPSVRESALSALLPLLPAGHQYCPILSKEFAAARKSIRRSKTHTPAAASPA